MNEFRSKSYNVLNYEFSCIFERYRDLPSILLPQARLRVYNVFLRRSYNKIVINFDGNDETVAPQVFDFLRTASLICFRPLVFRQHRSTTYVDAVYC